MYPRTLWDRRKRGIGSYGRKLFVAFVLGLAQINQTALQVACFRERLGKQEVESPPVTHGAVLQDRPAPGVAVLEELRIQCQRLTERGDGLLVFFVANVGIGKVPTQDPQITPNCDRLFIP